MIHRILTPIEKQDVLNRDGWCCNRCGYIPFYTSIDVPWWAKASCDALNGFINDLLSRPPVIFIEQDFPNYNLVWLHGGKLEFDHIIPIRERGLYNLDNVQALCHNCHRIKTSMESRYTESVKYSIHKFMNDLVVIP